MISLWVKLLTFRLEHCETKICTALPSLSYGSPPGTPLYVWGNKAGGGVRVSCDVFSRNFGWVCGTAVLLAQVDCCFFWIKVNFDASLRILMFLCAVLRFSDPPLRPSIMLSFSDGHKKIRMHVDVVEIPQRLPVNCWLFWQRMSEFYRMQCTYLIDRAMYSTVLSTEGYLTNFLSLIDVCVVCWSLSLRFCSNQ